MKIINAKNIKLLLIIIWMFIIFCFSNQKALDSSNLSDSFINNTIVKVYKIYNPNITKYEQKHLINKYSFITRKLAHFTLYLILGLLIIFFVREYNIKNGFIFYLLVCFLYACTDEFHQLFVTGRCFKVTDILIDTIGAFIGIKTYLSYINKKKNYN